MEALEKTYVLYFLIAKDRSRFKIGISKNVNTRWKALGSQWDFNFYESDVTIFQTEREAYKAEQTLHFMLEAYSVEAPQKEKSGHTEWFNYCCYEMAVTLLENIVQMRKEIDPNYIPHKRAPKETLKISKPHLGNTKPYGEKEIREMAALRVLIHGLPNSPGGVGPVIRLMEKRRLIKELWEQRKQDRLHKKEVTK